MSGLAKISYRKPKIEEEVIVAAHCRVCCALHSRSDNHLIQWLFFDVTVRLILLPETFSLGIVLYIRNITISTVNTKEEFALPSLCSKYDRKQVSWCLERQVQEWRACDLLQFQMQTIVCIRSIPVQTIKHGKGEQVYNSCGPEVKTVLQSRGDSVLGIC